jgi:hypothetical protein
VKLHDKVIINRITCGRLIFRLIGGFALTLALFGNPIVLRSRFWNVTAVVHEVALDVTLIGVGAGLIALRQWAAVGLSVATAFLAVVGGLDLFGICMVLTSLILNVVFWSSLVRGKRQDVPYLFAAVLISVVTECVAFAWRLH